MSNKDHLHTSGEIPKSGVNVSPATAREKSLRELDPAAIKSIAVHPAIGVARVGNAPDDWYLAPEVPGGVVNPSGKFRDDENRVLRQAARFRIYATFQSGEVIELTADEAEITWCVEIANLKAGWYEFNNAMDLPANLVIPSKRRNASITGSDRIVLDMRPSPIAISGPNKNGFPYRFANGKFGDALVYLGELRTDDKGRLIFLGGRGTSAPQTAGTRPTTFANNEGWHDDIADGPVRATVRIGESVFETTPGYVVTAPPNYAPGVTPIVTMDDVVRDVFIRKGWLPKPDKPSFQADIWPIFDRMTRYQWVNQGFFMLVGQGSRLDAHDAAVIAKLSDPSSHAAQFRRDVFALFRTATEATANLGKLPPVYGDTFGEYEDIALVGLSITATMYEALRRWADGDFLADWSGFPVPCKFDNLSPAAQTQALDRAALHECMGGPFHPGIEMTWIMRWSEIWATPYRLKLLPEGMAVSQEYGDVLTRDRCLAPDGPLSGVGPGALTRWLGIPWQTDEASCGSGADYSPSSFLTIPSFWGARVPNEVFTVEDWRFVTRPDLSEIQRHKHFARRYHWLRDIRGRNYLDRIANMVNEWWQVGIIVPQDGPPDAEKVSLPRVVHVESDRSESYPGDDVTLAVTTEIANLDQPKTVMAGAAPAPLTEKVARTPRKPKRTYNRGEV